MENILHQLAFIVEKPIQTEPNIWVAISIGIFAAYFLVGFVYIMFVGSTIYDISLSEAFFRGIWWPLLFIKNMWKYFWKIWREY
jgi:hypothetical protein